MCWKAKIPSSLHFLMNLYNTQPWAWWAMSGCLSWSQDDRAHLHVLLSFLQKRATNVTSRLLARQWSPSMLLRADPLRREAKLKIEVVLPCNCTISLLGKFPYRNFSEDLIWEKSFLVVQIQSGKYTVKQRQNFKKAIK